ncbi:aldo/keto reductase family protein [Kineothrix alysoides]|nr:aldo/keto reductase [Kineothrix alysoides]
MEELKLNNGMSIPLLGIGATGIWGEGKEPQTVKLIQRQYEIYCYALKSRKCRLFDTSSAYGLNEEVLGKAINDIGINRNEVILMSKISNSQQREGNVRKALEETLKKLNTDYLDVYLIHWPQTGTFINTYLQMEKMYKEGLVKSIGVCNFNIHHLEELRQQASIIPSVNQFEIHPLFTQDNLINYCQANNILPIAYSPIGRMHDVLINAKPVYELSRKYGKTPVQIILRWHYQLYHVAIPRTLDKNHFDDIFSVDEFFLEEREVSWISSINENIRLRYNPDTCDFSRL